MVEKQIKLLKHQIPPHLIKYFKTSFCTGCYICHMVQIFREVWRVLRPDGVLLFNMGDSYASDWPCRRRNVMGQGSLSDGRRSARPERLGVNLKPKDLCGIPWRLALALQADGWWLRSDIIWSKLNPMPESCTDRPTKSHEYIFLLTKSGQSQYWTNPRKGGTRTKPKPDYVWRHKETGQEINSDPNNDDYKRVNLWQGHDYFWDADAIREKTNGLAHSKGKKLSPPIETAGVGHKEWHKYTPDLVSNRNARSVWTIPTEPFKDAHFSTFPTKLVAKCIKAGTSERGCCVKCGAPWERVVEKQVENKSGWGKAGRTPDDIKANGKFGGNLQKEVEFKREKHDIRLGPTIQSKTIGWQPTCKCFDVKEYLQDYDNAQETDLINDSCVVFDPFGGSGTVLKIADRMGRKGIVMDLKYEYCQMAKNRCIKNQEELMFG